ncbi:MAG: hypothetical protein RLY86_2228 [Pseudomonadota bacterium]|jgi:hypothetical protein
MTVIAFCPARFTPADLDEWNAIALPKLERGLWGTVSRASRRDHDELVVRFPNLDRPVFRFERDQRGIYRLLFNDRKGWYEIGRGTTSAECLGVWRGKGPLPARGAEARSQASARAGAGGEAEDIIA